MRHVLKKNQKIDLFQHERENNKMLVLLPQLQAFQLKELNKGFLSSFRHGPLLQSWKLVYHCVACEK
jgi:hypothetical protein